MKPVMQMRLGWTLKTTAGKIVAQNTYFTPYELTSFDPKAEGFPPVIVDLTPRTGLADVATPITAEEGKRLSGLMGCVACHSIDGTTVGKVGPSWKGLFGSQVALADGRTTAADEAYLRESIKEPAAKIVRGYDRTESGMPSYEGVISNSQIEALIRYIMTLH